MSSKDRREYIKELLNKSESPKKGQELAESLGVTRQVIVKDIAILRAAGSNIIATPEGYYMPKAEKNNMEKILALSHSKQDIEDELKSIIKYGGIIKDVIVEHPVYGEIKAMLMIKTLYDVQNFINKVKKYDAAPLLALTRGIHLHTIEVESEENLNNIIVELKEKGYIIE
ncbi:transcription repressor NadR [Clostridium aestuarii]|uniref:Transcription repressor NadR n=1 Tax=Clostridium aestuarii TaxID=338193 RepID=A0ABT4D3P1_9CLOT|nr:transcription repressor NadR [Clostridium aestuarii]MCY6485846.1 transcription repressor NadR [Clostridium aestuarii]